MAANRWHPSQAKAVITVSSWISSERIPWIVEHRFRGMDCLRFAGRSAVQSGYEDQAELVRRHVWIDSVRWRRSLRF